MPSVARGLQEHRKPAIPEPAQVPDPIPQPATGMPPSERLFSILAREGDPASASNYRRVRGRLRAVGKWVQVYVDEQDLWKVGPLTLRDIVGTFDGHILPTASRLFGMARDVDGDGRFTVLVTGRLARLAGGTRGVDGFVRGADFDPRLPAPFGNRADLMYLSARLGAGPYLRTLLAHEYTHAVTFCRKVADHPGGFAGEHDEEGWLDEGLAHLVEDLHGFSRKNLDYRVRAFLAAPERYRLLVEDYYEDDLFRSHGNRGSTYLFLRWCADQFGPGLLPALVRSPLRGVENLERTTGCSFAELYRDWSVSLFLDPIAPKRDVNTEGSEREWPAIGPRTAFVRPGGKAEVWKAEGTTSHHVIVGASPTGQVAIEVSAPPEAEILVTAVRLPDDLPRFELAAQLETLADGSVGLRVEARQHDGIPVQLSTLGWEPLVPAADPSRRASSVGWLSGEALRVALGGRDQLNPAQRVESKTIPLPGFASDDGPLIVRLTGIDHRGRRSVAWAEVDPKVAAGELADAVAPLP